MKINLTFTKSGQPFTDTISVTNPTTLRVYQALCRKLRRVSKVKPLLVSWSIL